LSGEWDLRFYKSLSKLPERIDTDRLRFDKVSVPSTWQRTGYSSPVYLNCDYEFRTAPPELPEDMQAAIYKKTFDVGELSGRYILATLGISPCADIYLNGEFVGYREGSHNTACFDLTDRMRAGENELLIVVYKWCTGSFLECQDMFREQGIFRDVLLYHCPDTFIYDYSLVSEKKKNGYALTVSPVIEGDAQGSALTDCILDGNRTVAEKTAPAGEKIVFDSLDVPEWNAEVPAVCDIYITLKTGGKKTEFIHDICAFRDVRIRGNVYYFNGKKIKFKGVNHHDTHPTKGYAVSAQDLENDIKLMKELNVNAVRTSHYPPDPLFNLMAEIYGLYVIDEADIETHGCGSIWGNIDLISHDLKWAKHYVDRVRHLYERDKNRGSVAMWSLGNEAGGYRCQDKCYEYLKSTGTPVPVHYEGVVRNRRFQYDVTSEMYTSVQDMRAMVAGTRKTEFSRQKKEDLYQKRPFFLCEYCHAMGLGPGSLEDYWQLIYAHDNLMGGCIWEWADHVVDHAAEKKYKYRYTYGGDHGEPHHDGHFCVDALVYADRRLHTGAREMKNVYRPVRAALLSDGSVVFHNTNRFRSSGYLTVKATVSVDGRPVSEQTLAPDIEPLGKYKTDVFKKTLREHKNKGSDVTVEFVYLDGKTAVADDQVVVCEGVRECGRTHIDPDEEIFGGILPAKGSALVTAGKCHYLFDTKSGLLTSMIVGNRALTGDEQERFTINRAIIDNDPGERGKVPKHSELEASPLADRVDLLMGNQSIPHIEAAIPCYSTEESMAPDYIVHKHINFTQGGMNVDLYLVREDDSEPLPDITAFGTVLTLNGALEDVRYYGYGPYENMPDFKAQSHLGIFEDRVSNMHEPYVFPQGSGIRTGVRWVELRMKDGPGIRIISPFGEKPFAFEAHHFYADDVNKARHIEDLKDDPEVTVLSLYGFLRGIGSASCGPDAMEEYRLDGDARYVTLAYRIEPIEEGE
ncbi:MAG: hypothetical protein IJM45_06980, partial [Clostridia bacterium]|nr:hypothetical protein [Clostridia bacterium]